MLLAACDRHWDREAVGLFRVVESPFGISSWMCSACVKTRADQAEVARRRVRSAHRGRRHGTTNGESNRG